MKFRAVNQKIGFIGGGHMTRNFLAGLVTRPEIEAKQVSVFDRNPPKNEALARDFGVLISKSAKYLIENCDVLVISIKPQGLAKALIPLRTSFTENKPLVISLAAGTTLSSLEAILGENIAIIRAMPNMASKLGLGATGLLANSNVNASHRQIAQFFSDSVGISAWVDSDADIDSITALSGSGPAYFMLFIEHLAQVANDAGINHQDALRFATQTAIGAAKLVEQSEQSINTLIDSVCSKGGTTEQAVMQLNEDQLQKLVFNAFNAAKKRSQELANLAASA